MMGNAGPSVLQEGATEEKGEHARLASFVGAMAISDLVKSTLGPKGMDKILMSVSKGNQVTVTNDGATILKSIYVDNAAARVLVDISKAQDDEVGDGTTSVVVFAGELLRQAEYLVNQRVHPMTIIQGFREACTVAKEALEGAAKDHAADEEAFRKDLLNIARTTLSSKILTHDKNHFANLACDAVMRFAPRRDETSNETKTSNDDERISVSQFGFGVFLPRRSLLVFDGALYERYLHGIDAVREDVIDATVANRGDVAANDSSKIRQSDEDVAAANVDAFPTLRRDRVRVSMTFRNVRVVRAALRLFG